MIIRQAKLRDKENLVDILIKDGKFAEIKDHIEATAETEIDAKGHLVTPPFIESHIHLDAALSAGFPRFNESGSLGEAIAIANERKPFLTKESVKDSAREVVKWLIANGVLAIRAHTDFTPTFTTLDAILELKEEFKPYIDIQVVAFPQDGIFTEENALEKLEEAIKRGADLIGGLPQAELTREDGIEAIKQSFALANKYQVPIDMHADESGDVHSRYTEVIAKYALHYDMKGLVTASHTTAMHNYHNDYAASLIGRLKQAGINVVTNPFSNMTLQNRFDGYPKGRGLTRIDELLASDVNVSVGNDNIMDPFGPLGKGNMLQAAHLLVFAAHMDSHEKINQLFDMITHNAAQTLNLQNYGIKEGHDANCLILDASSEKEAIRLTSEALYVISKGNIISHTKPAERQLTLGEERSMVDFKR